MSIRTSESVARWLVSVGFASLMGCGSSSPNPGDQLGDGGSATGGASGSGAVGQSGATQNVAGSNASGGSGASSVGAAGGATVAGGSGGIAAGGQAAGGAALGGGGGAALGGGGTGAGSGGQPTGGSAGSKGGAGGSAAGGGPIGPQPNITIWIAGDSTVATGGPCPVGWGGKFKALFNDKVSVTNSAVAGRSVRSWLYNPQTSKDAAGECVLPTDTSGNPTVQARWTAMLNGMKAGDYLFIQFGINDSDSACPRHVGVNAFKTSYGVMAAAAKARGAQPVFVTPTSNIACSGSKVSTGTREPFVTATKDAGTQYGVPVINLNVLSTTLYASLGFCPIPGGGDVSATTTGAVGTFFCDDHTHFDTTGAEQIAGLVAKALTDQGIALSAYLK